MSSGLFSCPLCGNRFDPSEHRACGSCPINSDCGVVCCPVCGYSTVDESRSKAVKWITSKIKKDAVREKT